jgi:chromosome partitioning protein
MSVKLEDVVLDTTVPNLKLLPSKISLKGGIEAFAGDFEALIVKGPAAWGRAVLDVVVLDTPPTLGLIPRMRLVASTHLIIPIQSSHLHWKVQTIC